MPIACGIAAPRSRLAVISLGHVFGKICADYDDRPFHRSSRSRPFPGRSFARRGPEGLSRAQGRETLQVSLFESADFFRRLALEENKAAPRNPQIVCSGGRGPCTPWSEARLKSLN